DSLGWSQAGTTTIPPQAMVRHLSRGERWGFFRGPGRGFGVMKVEAVVVRDRVETVMEAVEEQTGHVGVTVVEAVGHGREKGITHEDRGRVFESRFLPKAHLTFVVPDEIAERVIDAVVDAAKTGHVNGDGICWMSQVTGVTHNRTGLKLEEGEIRGCTHGSPASHLLLGSASQKARFGSRRAKPGSAGIRLRTGR